MSPLLGITVAVTGFSPVQTNVLSHYFSTVIRRDVLLADGLSLYDFSMRGDIEKPVEKTWVPRFLHRDAGDVSGENEVKTTPRNPFPPVPPIWGYSTGETS